MLLYTNKYAVLKAALVFIGVVATNANAEEPSKSLSKQTAAAPAALPKHADVVTVPAPNTGFETENRLTIIMKPADDFQDKKSSNGTNDSKAILKFPPQSVSFTEAANEAAKVQYESFQQTDVCKADDVTSRDDPSPAPPPANLAQFEADKIGEHEVAFQVGLTFRLGKGIPIIGVGSTAGENSIEITKDAFTRPVVFGGCVVSQYNIWSTDIQGLTTGPR